MTVRRMAYWEGRRACFICFQFRRDELDVEFGMGTRTKGVEEGVRISGCYPVDLHEVFRVIAFKFDLR
jgi:hypothetical protein